MKDNLGFNEVNGDLKKPKSDLDEKQVHLPYDVKLLTILKDAVIITDPNFFITFWNPAAELIYGWKAEEVLGENAQKVLRTKFIGTERPETIQELISKGSYENEVVQYTKKNIPLFISTKVVTIKDDEEGIKGHIIINRDITKQNTEKKLKRSYNILNSIVENTTDAIYLKNLEGNYIMANSTVSDIVGKPMAEIIGKNDWQLFSHDEAERIVKEDKNIIKGANTVTFEEKIFSHIDGELRTYLSTKGPYRSYDDSVIGIFGIARDITHLKVADEKLMRSEEQYRTLFETMVQGVVYQDAKGKITAMNPAAERIIGYTLEEIKGRTSEDPIWHPMHPDGTEFPGDTHPSMVALKTGLEVEDVIMRIKYPSKKDYTWLNIDAVPQFRKGEKKPYQVFTTFEDITEHVNSEKKILKSEKRYHSLFNKMTEGFALHEIVCNEDGKPVDYRFIDINPAFEDLTGLKKEKVVGKLKSVVIPEDNVDWVKIYGNVAITGESIHFDGYSEALKQHFDVFSFSPAENQFAVLFTDITKRKTAENELKEAMKKLQMSNFELEQFAYVASHDLQEPLRMITSFLQLLQRRYGNRLDKDADDFIGFAVDGAARMHKLINDLLTYSRVNKEIEEFNEVDMNDVIDQVKINLDILIKENQTVITSDPLPIVKADKTQMLQLLQNLINNSIKYRSQKNPHINISVEKKGFEWLFSVEDNGIGIEPEYRERIFKIFQRLHGIEKYEGTGIGLAISKRIVERHGGMIWVNSNVIQGSIFNFTIRR